MLVDGITDCIMDMSFVRKHIDGFNEKYPNVRLFGTFYNFEDLLASKENTRENINNRLESLKTNILSRLSGECIILYEPYYEIIKENRPNVRFGRTLFQRLQSGYLDHFTEIFKNGENISDDLKESIIIGAKEKQAKKSRQIEDFKKYSVYFRNAIISEGNDPNELSFWKDKVKWLLKNEIDKYYRNGYYLPTNFNLDMNSFSIESCELFINVMAFYLRNKENNLTPGLNDNIDLLQLLYVRNGRKLLIDETKWIKVITSLNLASKYLHPMI